jgi:DNA-binding NtrC family response regulator
MIGSLLVADSEPASRALMQAYLVRSGWEVLVAETGRAAMEILEARAVDVAVVDLRLGDLNGISLIEQARMQRPGLPVIATAAAPTVELAVEAMRTGAVHFLSKPCDGAALHAELCRSALAGVTGHGEVIRLGNCLSTEPPMTAVLREAAQLAPSDLPVALCGAPGVGRKCLAAAMHQVSGRTGPLHTVDTSLLPAEQIRGRLRHIADTAGGREAVLVADVQQIRLVDQEAVAKLAAACGPSVPRLFATLSDTPQRLLAAGKVSKALVGQIGSQVLFLPPLAARQRDILLLAKQIIAQLIPDKAPMLSAAAVRAMVNYEWPGNIRQLRLVLERAARLAAEGQIELRHLPILQAVKRDPVPLGWTMASPINLQDIVDNVERQLIESALCRTEQNQAKAAELLGIPRTTLRDKLNKYGFTARSRGQAQGA